MGEIIAFPAQPSRIPPRGLIFVEPVDVDGGSWAVFRLDHSGERCISTRFAFAAAEAEARRIANETGATYDDGSGDAA